MARILGATAISLALLASSTTVQAWIPRQRTPSTSSLIHKLHAAASANSNIVLAPSIDDPAAFDNLKVGNARIHRYSGDEFSPETAEYVMWYHGRSYEMNKNEKLPRLSTGRIGRAVSRNGLHWVKDKLASESEDVNDVSLGLNKDSWWGFDTMHVGLGNVLLPVSTPAVMTDAGVYLMYYMGGSGEETAISEYMDDDITLPESMKDTKLTGMRMKIGVALSQDGITWGRIEADDPSGACLVPYDKSDPNQDVRSDMEEELYCAWPEVVVDLKADDKSQSFLMYYSTMYKSTKQKTIALAVSEDGFRWHKKGVCLAPTPGTLDEKGVARCCVVKDAVFDEATSTWTEIEGQWRMYYEGVSPEDNKHRILSAVSTDGKTWTKTGLALDVGIDDDAWDCKGVSSPHMIRLDDGTSRMYYTGQGADGSTAIGVAKLSQEGQTGWVREQAAISLSTI